ncbi:MAG: hypothetical protein ACYCST_21065 [Acidimicrobiales bacterium]
MGADLPQGPLDEPRRRRVRDHGLHIDWFNHRRLHGEITDDNSYVTPAEFEAAYYRKTAPALEAVTQ